MCVDKCPYTPSGPALVPDAKKAAGYFIDDTVSQPDDLNETKGRTLDDY